MKIDNKTIARLLHEVADQLEINLDNPYRIRAYRRAARSVEKLTRNLEEMVAAEEDITVIPYIGKGIAKHVKEIVQSGKISPPKKHKTKYQINPFKRVAGLGSKRIQALNKYNIFTKEDLMFAIKEDKLKQIKGFTSNLQAKILASINQPRKYEKFFKLNLAKKILDYFIKQCQEIPEIAKITIASSYRRFAEEIGNIDILVIAKNQNIVTEKILELEAIAEVVSTNENKISIILFSGMQITIHFVMPENYAIKLLYLTGSEAHLKKLQNVANEKNMILSEEGLLHDKKMLKTTTETDIYSALTLDFIEPELREDRGEITASHHKTLPNLISLQDIKGDLHSHTLETDGTELLIDMARAAAEKGYEYLAITDHSKRLTITNGLDEKRLLQQIELIDQLNSQFKNFTILKSIEVDILEDGSLDLPDYILKELDLRVCSIHSKFKLSIEQQTQRILRAMDNPYFNILGHPTGRIIHYRDPYLIHFEEILKAAKERGCFIELNAQPSRLDLKDIHCQLAKSFSVKIAISTDAHSIRELDFMPFGIAQARRGWLEAKDVINTRSLSELKKLLHRKS